MRSGTIRCAAADINTRPLCNQIKDRQMKIAVTAKGRTLESQMDPRFGRAQNILLIDAGTLAFEVMDNSTNKDAFKGAGIQAAAMICDAGAEVLLTGFCGPNAFKTLAAAGVKVVPDQAGRVIDVVQRFKQGDAVYAQSANAQGHW
jgi:predicted Fe-Mo cluster-binding NifX family protein